MVVLVRERIGRCRPERAEEMNVGGGEVHRVRGRTHLWEPCLADIGRSVEVNESGLWQDELGDRRRL